MRYESKPDTSKGIAIFTATFGAVLLYYAGFVASGAGAGGLAVLGAILLVLTVIAATARYSVTLDQASGHVVKAFNSLLINREWVYPVRHFSFVRIGAGGRGAFGEGTVVYSVQLKGSKTLNLTSWNDKKYEVETEAQKVADYLKLPYRPDEK